MTHEGRIKRTATFPRFAAGEAAQNLRYPYRLAIPNSDTVLQYRRTRQKGDLDYGEGLLRRKLFAWLILNGERIGAFEMNQIDPNGCADNDEFLMVMDASEKFEADMSDVLCTQWNDIIGDVTHAGPILDFRYAWIAPEHAGGSLFSKCSHALIDRFCPRYSILVIKAFPLEYEGREIAANPAMGRAVDCRERAMVRYYGSVFGVRPFPGKAGEEGWLFHHPANF